MDLVLIWAGIIAFAVYVYVVLDGFDLGVGLLFPFFPEEHERDLMMNSVAPVWDGNETWLVLGGGGLLAVFPLAYATLLPAVYAPIIAMLLGLVFRGVAFEYRWRTQRWKKVWDVAFTGGSLVAALSQGIILGAIVQGIHIEDRAYAGGWWDWLTPFSLLTGLAVVIGYVLLGCTWLVMKTEGELFERARRLSRPAALVTLAAFAIVSVWTPWLHEQYFERWTSWPTAIASVLLPASVALLTWLLFRGLHSPRHYLPFLASLGIFLVGLTGLGVNFFPWLLPPTLTIYDAAAPESSLRFTLVGAAVLIPLILSYTAYAYYVFRGKMDPSEGYH